MFPFFAFCSWYNYEETSVILFLDFLLTPQLLYTELLYNAFSDGYNCIVFRIREKCIDMYLRTRRADSPVVCYKRISGIKGTNMEKNDSNYGLSINPTETEVFLLYSNTHAHQFVSNPSWCQFQDRGGVLMN